MTEERSLDGREGLRILHLEDDELDAELVSDALGELGVPVEVVRESRREAFAEALASRQFDLIVSDYTIPGFDGLSALRMARDLRPDTPFIFVSGTIGEERAVEALQLGATDYVLKDRMTRLGPAVRRIMQESAQRIQRKLVEAQLAAAHAQMRRLLAASPAVLYSAPFPPGELVDFVSENVRTRFGHEPQDFTEKPGFWAQCIHPEDRAHVLQRLASLDTRDTLPLSYRLRRRDGSYRWVEDRASLTRDSGGHPVEIVGAWVDVTEMRQMEEQFHQAQKLDAIGSLAGGMAHDFNNILMIILSYSDFAIARMPPDSPRRHEVAEIRKAANRAADLVRQLLAFCRRQEVKPQEIQPDGAVRNVAAMLRRLIGENMQLSLELCGDPGLISCDPTQLDQVLINLVVNARDAMPDGGQIVIRTAVAPRRAGVGAEAGSPAGLEYEIAVQDTGVGMSPETRARIFEPFFTTKPIGKGTGLGLSMVYGAVTQNNGRLTVESELGKGTTMRLYFDRIEAGGGAEERKPPAAASLAGIAVLLVEDNEEVREILTFLLRGLGAEVVAAAHGAQALELSSGARVDVVVTDVMMPGMGGPELARRLRELHPGIPVLFCTGDLGELDAAQREGPGIAVIQKPFDAAAIAARIRSLLPRDSTGSAP